MLAGCDVPQTTNCPLCYDELAVGNRAKTVRCLVCLERFRVTRNRGYPVATTTMARFKAPPPATWSSLARLRWNGGRRQAHRMMRKSAGRAGMLDDGKRRCV